MTPAKNRLSLLAALAFLLVAGAAPALAQVEVQDDCDSIQGTVQVADDDADKQDLARVTPEQAAEAATAALSGATARDTDLEEEDGFLVYEVDLLLDSEEYDAYVDAGSGEVLCLERED